jgi:hypothetical protein
MSRKKIAKSKLLTESNLILEVRERKRKKVIKIHCNQTLQQLDDELRTELKLDHMDHCSGFFLSGDFLGSPIAVIEPFGGGENAHLTIGELGLG